MRRPLFPALATAAAGVTYLLIVVGGVVRVTGSGLGCGLSNEWPLCQGGLLPPLQVNAIIEFSHRWIAAVATLLVIALTVAAWMSQRRHRRIVVAATAAAVLFLLQIALGALTVKYRLPGGVVMVHLANALLLLGVLTYIAVTARRQRAGDVASFAAGPARMTALAAGATYLLALSGALVVETGSSAGCAGWPLCGSGFQLPAAQMDIINLAHRVVAGVAVLLIATVMLLLLRDREQRPSVRRWSGVVLGVAALQVIAGALVVEFHLPPAAQAVHVALASALWASMVIVAVIARPALAPAPVPARDAPRVERGSPTPASAAP